MTTTTIELKPSSHPLPAAEREAILANPGFGRHFTDHMVTVKWTEGRGWHEAQLVPYAPLSIDPANMTLHYAQTIFEGLKAFQQPDGTVATFRPDANAARFQASARRLAMPELPVETFIAACDALVKQDRAWVPANGEQSLYLRPFMIATEVGLGVRPANEYLFVVIASPAGAYFPSGVKPVSVWLSEEYVRAAPGGPRGAPAPRPPPAAQVGQAPPAQHGSA
ncbi:branched chain amino acid aminotransferase, partial [Streptomyces sp. HSW2009]